MFMLETNRTLLALAAVAALIGGALVVPLRGSAQELPRTAPRRDLDRATRDVEVMRRILAREALGSRSGPTAHEYRNESGFLMYTNVANAATVAEGYFVDGHGAVFLLRTSDPVTPPSQPAADGREEPDTLWDRTVADVEGRPTRMPKFDFPNPNAYDAEKVRALEDRILTQLARFGDRMTELHDDESVVVIVTGGPVSTMHTTAVDALTRATGADRPRPHVVVATSGATRSARTLRVRMRDVRAVARSGAAADALRPHTVIHAY